MAGGRLQRTGGWAAGAGAGRCGRMEAAEGRRKGSGAGGRPPRPERVEVSRAGLVQVGGRARGARTGRREAALGSRGWREAARVSCVSRKGRAGRGLTTEGRRFKWEKIQEKTLTLGL